MFNSATIEIIFVKVFLFPLNVFQRQQFACSWFYVLCACLLINYYSSVLILWWVFIFSLLMFVGLSVIFNPTFSNHFLQLLWIINFIQINNFALWLWMTDFWTNSTTCTWMNSTIKMLNSIRMENTKRQSRLWINLLSLLFHMGFFLSLLKLSKEKLSSILNYRFDFCFFTNLFIFLNQMFKNGVIDW